MAEINLKNNRGTVILDDEIMQFLNKFNLRIAIDKNGYPEVYGKLHHLAIGRPEKGVHVDHINRNKLDARKSNLRFCTPAQNSANAGPRKGNYKGVRKNKTRNGYTYHGGITLSDKRIHLGVFNSAEDAAYSYDLAAKLVHKEFAYINFPDGYSSNYVLSEELVQKLNKAVKEYKGMKTIQPGIFLKSNNTFMASKVINKRKTNKTFKVLENAIAWRNSFNSI